MCILQPIPSCREETTQSNPAHYSHLACMIEYQQVDGLGAVQ